MAISQIGGDRKKEPTKRRIVAARLLIDVDEVSSGVPENRQLASVILLVDRLEVGVYSAERERDQRGSSAENKATSYKEEASHSVSPQGPYGARFQCASSVN
jgi:hypothetical protein